MNSTPTNFKIFRILHLALATGMGLFAVASFLLVRMRTEPFLDVEADRALQLIVVTIALLALYFGFRLFKNRILKIRKANESAEKRLTDYRTACITWWLLIEIPGVLAFTCFLLTGNHAFFALGIFHLMILIMFTPRRDNILLLLNLKQEDLP
ncbi:MAG: hypothetical protein EOO04_37495 [Chitinophagaceae bacterium]|nr:MAG: hypothetical protein EOO04_37495 [Chitinophagaceae bacterium]